MDRDRDIIETKTENRREGTAEKVGEGAGAIGGGATGAAIGSAAGPVGTIIGGIAGAVGGWWAGEKVGRALESHSEEDDAHYRKHYRTVDGDVPNYEDARVGYVLGSVAGRHPGYRDSAFEDVEADLRHGFNTRHSEWDYEYDQMRPYIREGYTRGRTLSLK